MLLIYNRILFFLCNNERIQPALSVSFAQSKSLGSIIKDFNGKAANVSD